MPGYAAMYGSNGMAVLASYLDCTEPYSGEHQRDDVFVIGLGTEAERIFTLDEAREALDYAKTSQTKLTRLTSHTLCHEAMVELFGS